MKSWLHYDRSGCSSSTRSEWWSVCWASAVGDLDTTSAAVDSELTRRRRRLVVMADDDDDTEAHCIVTSEQSTCRTHLTPRWVSVNSRVRPPVNCRRCGLSSGWRSAVDDRHAESPSKTGCSPGTEWTWQSSGHHLDRQRTVLSTTRWMIAGCVGATRAAAADGQQRATPASPGGSRFLQTCRVSHYNRDERRQRARGAQYVCCMKAATSSRCRRRRV